MERIKEVLIVIFIIGTLSFGIISNTLTTILLFWIVIFGLWSISSNQYQK